LAAAFLICALDLEKWRISVRNTGRTLRPRQRLASAGFRSGAAVR
jgi:hypothetical protein